MISRRTKWSGARSSNPSDRGARTRTKASGEILRIGGNRTAGKVQSVSNVNISVKGQYALHAIFDLAMYGTGEPVRIADIAKRQKIPQKFLELILAGLKQGRFVESRRGAEGGYLLTRPPDAITVGEVLRFVEGNREPRPSSRAQQPDAFAEVWRTVDEAVSRVVDHTSFAEVVRSWREGLTRYVENWDI